MDSSLRSIAVSLGLVSVALLATCSSSVKPAPGMACALNSDCASSLICTFGLCHSACSVNSDCPPGELCVKSGSVGDGGVAAINVCQLPVESKCVYNSQCSPLVCARDEMCRNECLTSADCVSPQVCTDSKVCALSSQLAPGTNDVPVAGGAVGLGCALNSDCAPGLICKFGLCHSACVVNSDCQSGELCVKSGSAGDGGASSNVCQLPAESKCIYNSDCTTPLVCARDEMCRNQCLTSVDCVSPQVCTNSKVCALSSQLIPGTNDVPLVTGGGGAGGASGGAGSSGAGGKGGGSGGVGMDGGTVIGDPCGAPADAGYYVPESVPNNDREHATVLSVGVGYAACIQTPTDVDWYTVTVPSTGQGGYLTIGLTAVAQTASLRTDLYSASTNGLIHTNDGSNAGSSVYTWIAAAAGAPFNIEVSGVNADSRAVGAYTFTASFQPAVEATEPNNDRAHATPLALGTPIQGLFFRGYVDDMTITDPSDYYKITLPAAGMLSATVTGISSSLRGEVALYDSAGGSLATADSASETPGADAQVMYSATTSGTYYVLVTEPHLGDVPLVGEGRTLPDIATQPYTLTVTSP